MNTISLFKYETEETDRWMLGMINDIVSLSTTHILPMELNQMQTILIKDIVLFFPPVFVSLNFKF